MINDILNIYEIAKNFDVNLVLQFSQAEISNLVADVQFLYNQHSYKKLNENCKWVKQIDPDFEDTYQLSSLSTIKQESLSDTNIPAIYTTDFNTYKSVAFYSYKKNSVIQ